MPALLKGPTRPMAMMKHQEAVSKFVAFKFPDRSRLHLACTLVLCRGSCEKVNKINVAKENSIGKFVEFLLREVLKIFHQGNYFFLMGMTW